MIIKGKKINIFYLLLSVFLFIAAVIYLYPFYLVIINSLKTFDEVTANAISLPKKPAFDNFWNVWKMMNYPRLFFNTLFVTCIGVIGITLLSSMAGYKLSRAKGFTSWLFFFLIISPMMIPFHSYMISLVKTARVMNLNRSLLGLGILYCGMGVPLAVFMYHGFVKKIPKSLDECALIDGVSHTRLFFQIIFPLLQPVTVSIIILNAILIWNDFLLPMLVLGGDRNSLTLQLAVSNLIDQNLIEWNYAMAWVMLTIIPVIVFYFLLQQYIVKGIVAGTVRKI